MALTGEVLIGAGGCGTELWKATGAVANDSRAAGTCGVRGSGGAAATGAGNIVAGVVPR